MGMSGYLQFQFNRNYSRVTTPVCDRLRELRFSRKRGRRVNIPFGEFQQAKNALTKALTSPPILALSDSYNPFRPHTDAIEIGAGAVLTQF